LISEQSSQGSAGIPLLKDVPLLGQLFNTNSKSGARSELIILITPYIISDDREAETVTSAFRKMLGPWAGTVGEAETKQPSAMPAASAAQRSVVPPAPAASAPAVR
jgi:general secretion pathway protein D